MPTATLKEMTLRELVDICTQIVNKQRQVSEEEYKAIKTEVGTRSIRECCSW